MDGILRGIRLSYLRYSVVVSKTLFIRVYACTPIKGQISPRPNNNKVNNELCADPTVLDRFLKLPDKK